MKTDITLEYGSWILIIDAKVNSQDTSKNYGKNVITHQTCIRFLPMLNKALEMEGNGVEVCGMLLYARTNESIQPDSDYMMSGNMISVKTLDLNQEFCVIKLQLDVIVEDNLMKNKF